MEILRCHFIWEKIWKKYIFSPEFNQFTDMLSFWRIYQHRVNFPLESMKCLQGLTCLCFLERKGSQTSSSTLSKARWSWATKKWVGEKNDWIPPTSQFYFHSWKVASTISIMTRRSEAKLAALGRVNIADAAAHAPRNNSETLLY